MHVKTKLEGETYSLLSMKGNKNDISSWYLHFLIYFEPTAFRRFWRFLALAKHRLSVPHFIWQLVTTTGKNKRIDHHRFPLSDWYFSFKWFASCLGDSTPRTWSRAQHLYGKRKLREFRQMEKGSGYKRCVGPLGNMAHVSRCVHVAKLSRGDFIIISPCTFARCVKRYLHCKEPYIKCGRRRYAHSPKERVRMISSYLACSFFPLCSAKLVP